MFLSLETPWEVDAYEFLSRSRIWRQPRLWSFDFQSDNVAISKPGKDKWI